jgi:putative membrane protein
MRRAFRQITALTIALAAALAASPTAVAQPAAPGQAPVIAPELQKTMSTIEAFVIAAAIGDKFEIESSQLALERSKRDEVTMFAQLMIKDHTEMSEGLAAAVRDDQLNVTVPDKLDAKHAALLTKLHELPQGEFDRAYLDAQMDGHRAAVELFRAFVQSPTEGALGRFARAALPMVEGHFQHIEALHKTSVIGAR